MTTPFDFSTQYLGLMLKNPFVVASSGLTSTLDKVIQCAEAGAGAVVLKSIFEEQIKAEADRMSQYNDYPEAAEYLGAYTQSNALKNYLELIEESSKACDIPIIASINCSSSEGWVDYAVQIERAGAAALELNIFLLPTLANQTSSEVEAKYLSIVERVLSVISIPLSVKLSDHFTAPLNMIQQLYFRGVKGVTLFNRFYTPDVDINRERVHSGGVFSSPVELGQRLRWVGLTRSEVPLIDVALSGGVHSFEDIIKGLLCGADVVQLCSVLYDKGLDNIAEMLRGAEIWALKNKYNSLKDFAGKLSARSVSSSEIFERAQFMKYFSMRGE